MQRRNPLSFSLSFGITPSNNINNAADSGSLGGLSLADESRALSGVRYTLGGDVRYRLHMDRQSATSVFAGANIQTYSLTDAAKRQAPSVSGDDYAYASLSFGLMHRRVFSDTMLPTDFSIRVGKNWYGGAPYDQFVAAGVGQSWEIDPQNSITASLNLEKRRQLDTAESFDIRIAALAANWTYQFANRDALTFGGKLRRNRSDGSALSDFEAKSLRVSYDIAKPIAGITVGFGIEAENRDFSRDIFNPDGFSLDQRKDDSVSVDVSFGFEKLEFYGFRPFTSINARRTDSSIDIFDREAVSLGFDLRSSF